MTDPLRIALDQRRAFAEEIERLNAFIRAGEHLLRDSSLANVDADENSATELADWQTEGRRSADNVIYLSEVSARVGGGRTVSRSRSDCGPS